MGYYLNSDNVDFQKSLNSIFVDKSDAVRFFNTCINSNDQFICVSRPRRFGKSMMTSLMNAYYSKGCDSKTLFDNLNIAKDPSYLEHLNKHHVIWIDIQEEIRLNNNNADTVLSFITEGVIKELEEEFQSTFAQRNIPYALRQLNLQQGLSFIIIIDEWDAVFRDCSHNKKLEKEYIEFLGGLFKDEKSQKKFISLAYITGILPLARYKSQSALNNFKEYTMLDSKPFSRYYGFTEEEVSFLCTKTDISFEKVKEWYDGYVIDSYHMFNPNSVVTSIIKQNFKSYWTQTAAFEDVSFLIESNFKGLRDDFIDLISKGSIKGFDFSQYNNDLTKIDDREKAITYLIHLGYLTYNEGTRKIYIPNLEVKNEIVHGVLKAKKGGIVDYIKQSREVLIKTILGDTKFVADTIADIHEHRIPIIQYNNENSLAITVDYAYIASLDYYEPSIREYPSGKGYADIVYIPRIEYLDEYPAIVVELKWDGSADDAVAQIKERNYLHKVQEKTDNIILVGINYNSKSKEHSCVIEKF